MNGPSIQPGQESKGVGQGMCLELGVEPVLTEDERFVVACTRAAKKAKLVDPYQVARVGSGWSRERWDDAMNLLQSHIFNYNL